METLLTEIAELGGAQAIGLPQDPFAGVSEELVTAWARPSGHAVPVVPLSWQKAVVDERGRVEHISYELRLLGSLRDALHRREVWVVGAARRRDPEADLPQDFEPNRDVRRCRALRELARGGRHHTSFSDWTRGET